VNRPVTIAVVGCGTLTRGVILPHLAQPDFAQVGRVVALCDLVGERARDLAQRWGVPAWYDSMDALLAGSDADAVLVITPGTAHAALALQAVRAGRHVYVQKPMAPTLAAARELATAAEQAGVVLVAAPGQVLWPLYQQMRAVLQDGQIGAPYMAMPPMLGWPGQSVYFPNDPRHFFGVAGGPLRDHGGYGIQTLVALFGSVRRVAALSANVTPQRLWNGTTEIPTPGHDNSALLLDFGGGVTGMVHDAWCARSPGSSLLRVHCQEGTLETSHASANDLAILPYACTMTRGGETRTLAVDLGGVPFCANGHIGLGHTHVYGDILHLVTCIREKRRPRACGRRGMHLVEVIEAAFRAAQTGITQELQTRVPDDAEEADW
jgi:predicted dehydrogenase